jgi:hypothetical protein
MLIIVLLGKSYLHLQVRIKKTTVFLQTGNNIWEKRGLTVLFSKFMSTHIFTYAIVSNTELK